MALVAQLTDGTTTLSLVDGSNYWHLDEGIDITPPEPIGTYAASPDRNGEELVNVRWSNTRVEMRLKISGDSVVELERNAAKILDYLRMAREDALAKRTPRVGFEYRKDGGVMTVSWDILDGHLALPKNLHARGWLENTLMYGVPLTLVCKPFCRGYERALAKAQSAIPREDADPATDEGIGIFGDATNLCVNPVFYANVTDGVWGNYSFAPDEFARYVNIKDSAGVVMPTCARFRSNAANEGKAYSITGAPLATTFTFSVYLRGRGTPRLIIDTDGTGGTGSTITLTDNWTRYSVTATIGGAPTYVNFNIINPDGATYIDCFVTKWMIARESFRSPFTPEAEYWAVDNPNPGTSGTGTIYQLAPGHSWTGTAHNSTSSRSGVDAAGTAFDASTTGLAADKGLTLAFWAKSRGWAWNDSAEHQIVSMSAVGANYFSLQKSSNNIVSLEVRDSYNLYKLSESAAVAHASDTWVHVVAVIGTDGTITSYTNAVAGSANNQAGATGRIEYLAATMQIGSRTDGTNIWQGFIQVQAILPYAATAAQVAALYNAGRQGNRLGYIEPNGNAAVAVENDTNTGTQTFSNRNSRAVLRDVQGQADAPFRVRIYNPVATARTVGIVSTGRFDGVPAPHIANLAADTNGTAVAGTAAFGGTFVRYGTVSASAVQRIASAAIVSDHQPRRYRVLLRALAETIGDSYYATVRLYYGAGVTKILEKLVQFGIAGYRFYDLGEIWFPPEFAKASRAPAASWDIRLYIGNATKASQQIDADYLVFLPVDAEVRVQVSGLTSNRWQSDELGYLSIDTREDELRAMLLNNAETTASGMPQALGDGVVGDVILLKPGDSHLVVLADSQATWGQEQTWQLNEIRYAPRHLLPPGI